MTSGEIDTGLQSHYDAIVCGTGLKECIISGLLSVKGKKVLHLDRNKYYGGEGASLNLETLYEKYKPETDGKIPEGLGRSRDYSVDLCPKFIMACGNLVKLLLHTKVTKYLKFQVVGNSYVYKDGKIHRVPSTPSEALNSKLMGVFQKRKFRNFLVFCQDFEFENKATWKNLPIEAMTMKQLYENFGCDDNTAAFTGHALALHTSDDYLDDLSQTIPTIERIKLYAYSLNRYGQSPYIYPLWGLGGLPEGFSRLSAIHGGMFMLNADIKEFTEESGKITGVKLTNPDTNEVVAITADQIVSDPSYFKDTEHVKTAGKIVRKLYILDHPIPNTDNANSCQVIIPSKHLGRKHDVYVAVVSAQHEVCAPGKYLAMISTHAETDNPEEELKSALDLLGAHEVEFSFTSELLEPTEAKEGNNLFVFSSFDATSHFETTSEDVLAMWKKVTGEELDMTISADPDDLENDEM